MPTLNELESRWQPSSRKIIQAMKEWRRQHPRATFKEIETALDEQLARSRRRPNWHITPAPDLVAIRAALASRAVPPV